MHKKKQSFFHSSGLCNIFLIPFSQHPVGLTLLRKPLYIFGLREGSSDMGKEDVGKLLMNLNRKCL